MRCTYCGTAMDADPQGRTWCPNGECAANVGNPRDSRPVLPEIYDGQPCDHAWARKLAHVMLTNTHSPGILNLCRCYQALVEHQGPKALPSDTGGATLEPRI